MECYECDCWDSDREGCTMPSCDLYYACSQNNETEFFMPMIPPTVTHQEKKISVKNGKPFVYEPAELKEARSKLMAYLSKNVPEAKYTGAVRLTVKWLFPRGKHKNGEYKITKPDTDNLNKLLKDCMTECGFWKDDALVASEICEKFWADNPGIYIKIEEL
jgi:Holliday junction resolvase RusA-like endonuclease